MFAIIAAIMLLFTSTAETPECEAIHTLVGGDLVEWIGYPQGWDLPDDLERIGRIDFAEGGVWELYSESERTRYITVFVSYEQTTDANGNHLGAHDFCGPYRIADD